MSFDNKGSITTYTEVDPHDVQHQNHMKKIRLIDGVRIGLTGLALLCGLTVLGTSANTLAVYNTTHLSSDFHLPLWPDRFNVRPTVALVVGGTLVAIANIVSLLFSKTRLRNQVSIHSSVALAAPFVGFTAVMISMIFFYVVNASTTDNTLQSWSCLWGSAVLSAKPHFGSLCNESQTALYLSIVLVPVELTILTLAGYQSILERKSISARPLPKSGSPVPSS